MLKLAVRLSPQKVPSFETRILRLWKYSSKSKVDAFQPGRCKRDVEMQSTTWPSKASHHTMQRTDSDEITLARNKVLAKKEKAQTKPTVAEELEAVRKRVLLKPKQEKRRNPLKQTNIQWFTREYCQERNKKR